MFVYNLYKSDSKGRNEQLACYIRRADWLTKKRDSTTGSKSIQQT